MPWELIRYRFSEPAKWGGGHRTEERTTYPSEAKARAAMAALVEEWRAQPDHSATRYSTGGYALYSRGEPTGPYGHQPLLHHGSVHIRDVTDRSQDPPKWRLLWRAVDKQIPFEVSTHPTRAEAHKALVSFVRDWRRGRAAPLPQRYGQALNVTGQQYSPFGWGSKEECWQMKYRGFVRGYIWVAPIEEVKG